MKSQSKTFVLALGVALLAASVLHACPTCKEGLNEDGGNLVRGYFWSIMFMMSMPFLILSALSSMFYLDVRRARQRQLELADAQLELATSTAN